MNSTCFAAALDFAAFRKALSCRRRTVKSCNQLADCRFAAAVCAHEDRQSHAHGRKTDTGEGISSLPAVCIADIGDVKCCRRGFGSGSFSGTVISARSSVRRERSLSLLRRERLFCLCGRVFSFDLAVCHDPIFIGNIRKIIEPVFTEQQRFSLLLECQQNLPQLPRVAEKSRLAVGSSRRKNICVHCPRGQDGDQLPFAAGKLIDIAILQPLQMKDPEGLIYPPSDFYLAADRDFQDQRPLHWSCSQ